MPRILIIDADSMLGHHCAAEFERTGWTVLGTASRPKPGSGFVPCQLTRRADIDSVVSVLRPDVIVSCSRADFSAKPDALYSTHVAGSLNLLGAAAKYRLEIPVLLTGCGSEYGSAVSLPAVETAMPAPDTLFGASRLAQTQAVAIGARDSGLPVMTVRPFAIVGRGLTRHSAVGRIFHRVRQTLLDSANETEFDVNGAQTVADFVDARDVARACRLLIEKAVPQPGQAEVYNVATQLGTRLLDVASILGRQAGLKPRPLSGEPGGWLVSGVGNFSKLRKATGWSPEFTWRQSLAEICRPADQMAQPV